jgi:hypothetical protein
MRNRSYYYRQVKKYLNAINLNVQLKRWAEVGSTTGYWLTQRNRFRPLYRVQKIINKNKLIDENIEQKLVKTENIINEMGKVFRSQKDIFDDLINRNKFNEILNIIINENKSLTLNQAQVIWNKIQSQGRHIMTLTKTNGEQSIVAFNDTTKDYIIELLLNGGSFMVQETWGSDTLDEYAFEDLKSLEITKYKKPERIIKNKSGKFFPYINTTNIDLIEYQIFTQEQAYNKELTEKREHCLTYTLLSCGVDESLVNNVKMAYAQNCNIRKNELKNISKMIKQNITLHYFNSNPDCDKIYTMK